MHDNEKGTISQISRKNYFINYDTGLLAYRVHHFRKGFINSLSFRVFVRSRIKSSRTESILLQSKQQATGVPPHAPGRVGEALWISPNTAATISSSC
jgi:hypothetical protein